MVEYKCESLGRNSGTRERNMHTRSCIRVLSQLLPLLTAATCAAAPIKVPEQEEHLWKRWLIPLPKEVSIREKAEIPVSSVRVRFPAGTGPMGANGATLLSSWFRERAGTDESEGRFEILLGVCDAQGKLQGTAVPGAERLATLPNAAQAYVIRPLGPDRLVLAAIDERGLYYAAVTLRQLLEGRIRGRRVEMPLAVVTDWPDIEERGLWGCHAIAALDIRAMAAHKMNLVESYETQLRVLPDGRGIASFELKESQAAHLSAMTIVPIITHFDYLGATGLFEAFPELKAVADPTRAQSSKVKVFPCASKPRFVGVLADWMTGLADCKGVNEISVWLSEHNVHCGCDSCRRAGQYVQETRAILAAWGRVRETHPQLGLRILLTQGSYPTNDKVLAEIPESVKVTFYDGTRTYDSTRRQMIYPLLEEFAAKGRWLGCYPQLTAWWRIVSPWSGPQFVKARMTEFARKKLHCVCGFAPPNSRMHDFNLTAAAEWSWNAEGRSERDFSLAYATRRGLRDPDAFADWTQTLGPVSWDIYGSYVPYPAFFDMAVGEIAKGTAPRLGDGIFRYFPEPAQFDRDLAAADHALTITRKLDNEGILQETLIVRGYIEMLAEVYHISRIAAAGDHTRAAELWQQLDHLSEAGRRTAAALEAWEKTVEPGIGGERFRDTLNVTRDLADVIGKALQPRFASRPAPGSTPESGAAR